MPLSPHTRIGPYEVDQQIGEGGMGTVYRARDTKLNRNVALKVLPEILANDPDRRARFHREAQVLASINHPHIAAIYGFEDADDIHALVLELVEGPTLADRLLHGRMPIHDLLLTAAQIAEALEAAHELGIIHRDLKPANVKVRDDGTVKVLDFGLAKLADSAAGTATNANVTASPTLSMHATLAGVILGTAAYMSPEQARGRPVDKRADIWAFGCVLFEMLTGRRAFEGDDISTTLAAVVLQEPDWNALPHTTPVNLRRLLERCLKKDVRSRLRDIGDARLQIEDLLKGEPDAVVETVTAAPAPRPIRASIMLTGGLLAATAALSVLATWFVVHPPPAVPPDLARFKLELPTGQKLGTDSPDRDLALTPDGRHLVLQESLAGPTPQLVVRAIDQLDPVPLQGASGGRWPFTSPDSRWIGFFMATRGTNSGNGELRKIPISGGPAVRICTIEGQLLGASWGTDDTIIFATSVAATGLMSVPAAGGEPKVLTKPDPAQNERDHLFPSMLPDGHAVLFTISSSNGPFADVRIAALDLKTGKTKTLIRGARQAEYLPTGHLVYMIGDTLQAVRFDPVGLDVLGEPMPIGEHVVSKPTTAADFSVSRDGTLVYVTGTGGLLRGTPRTMVWIDRKGQEEPIPVTARGFVSARLSPDGARVALDTRDEQSDIWIWDLARQTLQRLTNDPGFNRSPIWTPDGRRVAFSAEHDGVESVYWQAFDGSGTMERLSIGNRAEVPVSFSPDGKHLIFKTPLGVPSDLGVITLGATPTATLLLHSPQDENNGVISPDGRWLAYNSDESGRDEVYVRPFPDVESARQQVSTNGGTRPLWSRTGRELFYYVQPDTIMSVPVQLGTEVGLGRPQPVVKGPYAVASVPGRHYDVSADGQRFLLLKDAPAAGGQPASEPVINVVLNWFTELEQRAPAR